MVGSLPRRRGGDGVGPQPPGPAGRGGGQQGEDASTLPQRGALATRDGGRRGAVAVRGYHGGAGVLGRLRDERQAGAGHRGLGCRANHGLVPDTPEDNQGLVLWVKFVITKKKHFIGHHLLFFSSLT